MPTTRHRLDRSLLRQFAIRDWMADKVEEIRPFAPRNGLLWSLSAGSC
jgi:hypothetical protein